MKLEMQPRSVDEPSSGPLGMRTQRYGRVVAVLDGDAHLHAWEPNVAEDRLGIDLTKTVALVIDIGLDAPPAREPHWTDADDTSVVIVSLDCGARGVVTVDGHSISESAAVKLAADGFVQLLRDIVAERSVPEADPAADDRPDPPTETGA